MFKGFFRFSVIIFSISIIFLVANIFVPSGILTTSKDKETSAMNKQIFDNDKYSRATFAGGCFWCMEPPFVALDGVKDVEVGYSGGGTAKPTYEKVSAGNTGHYESVQIVYNPQIIPYEKLLDVYWRQIDPTDPGGQFNDRGPQYRTAIFYHNQEQKQKAENSKKELDQSGKFSELIVTEIKPFQKFYSAELYHQDYYKKNPMKYKSYKKLSGRQDFLTDTWTETPDREKTNMTKYKDFQIPDDQTLRETLTPLQYEVTQNNGTERPFHNKYWNNKREGIYVDIVSGEPLLSSANKFQSGSGWPSFTQPLEPSNIVELKDTSLGTVRTELRSKYADSHLGHVFNDGPQPTGKRYCINSAALEFIPRSDLETKGYGKYKNLFS